MPGYGQIAYLHEIHNLGMLELLAIAWRRVMFDRSNTAALALGLRNNNISRERLVSLLLPGAKLPTS